MTFSEKASFIASQQSTVHIQSSCRNEQVIMGQSRDPAVDIHEELKALKNALGTCNDEIRNLISKNEELEAKNADLESINSQFAKKHVEADRRINEIKKLMASNGIDDLDSDSISMNLNAYSMLFTSRILSLPFIASFTTCTIQYTVFSLFLLDLINTTSVPPGVTVLVRVCQVIAIIIAFLVETDLLRALDAVIYREGFDEMKVIFADFDPMKFYLSNALKGMQGLLGKFVAFFLIIFSDNVFDLLLNFTAVMFVSELDEILFWLSRAGYVGRKAERLAKRIEKTKLKPNPPGGILRYLHLGLYSLVVVCAFVAFAAIARQQDSQESLAEFVKVRFGDEVNPVLGLFSGCYEKQLNDGWDARVQYVQTQPDRGQGEFQYCLQDDLQTWIFANSTSDTACDNDGFTLRSAEERSTSFDLLNAKGDQWLLRTGNPISEFQLGEIDPSRFEIECGNIEVEESSTNEELCPVMTLDGDATGFSGSRDWSRTFVMLEKENNETVQFYQRPVFIGESLADPKEGYEVLFFAGRRWVIASAFNLMNENTNNSTSTTTPMHIGDASNKTDIASRFEAAAFWLLNLPSESLAFLSEAVSQDNDRGTPLGLQWYSARYAVGIDFPFADISRRVDASFRCGKCNSRTNPCLYEGLCLHDGTCECQHGAKGKLCETKPLADGVCNPYFNRAPNMYDGGDCCVATCSEPSCGVNGTSFAFGHALERGGIGYPHCKDPSMVPLTISLQQTHRYDGDSTGRWFESYTVDILCEEGAKNPLRVSLDPNELGTINETLYLEDKEGPCLLSFTGIQEWTWLNISYQVFDGSHQNADSMLFMSEEQNITSDRSLTLPALYSRCLKETLAGTVDHRHLYKGNYQDTSFSWLNNEVSRNDDCTSNQEYWIQRYALVALSTAEEIISSNEEETTGSWINSTNHCVWPRVQCDGSRVVEYSYTGTSGEYLAGLLAPEFALLRHLGNLVFFHFGQHGNGLTYVSPLERLEIASSTYSHSSIPATIGDLTSLTWLSFVHCHLTGSIPSEIGNLDRLLGLTLGDNFLSGTVPSEIGLLTALTELGLYGHRFSGSIPTEIGNLSLVNSARFEHGTLSGFIPTELMGLSLLTGLHLQDNALSGTIPTEIGNLSIIGVLQLSSNALSGSLPSEIGNLSDMWSLDIYENALTGTIPTEFAKLGMLNALALHANTLSGTIPSDFGALTSLTSLYLFNTTISGTIPSEIGNWKNLWGLYIHTNPMSGPIPSEVGEVSSLNDLFLYNNGLTGRIPSELGALNHLKRAFLETNQLTGPIPSELGNLSTLVVLDLSRNNLSGSIPSDLSAMTAMARIDLRHNFITGSIPSSIGNWTSMQEISFSNNTITGTIPSEIGLITSLRSIEISNCSIFGSLPTEIGLLENLSYLDLRANLLGETLPSEIGLLTNLNVLLLSGNRLSGLPTEILRLTSLIELELSDNILNEDEVNDVLVPLGFFFSCDSTTVEMEVITDFWPAETSWEITTANGTVAASGGNYTLGGYTHKEKICVPAEACIFTLFDQYEDGGPVVEIARLGEEYEIDGIFTDKVVIDICGKP